MTACPLCDHENIEGADVCEQCQQPLDDAYLSSRDSGVERSLLTDRVGVLNPKTPITVETSAKVGPVLRSMVEKSIGCVIVMEAGQPVGVFSERDALMRLNTAAADLADHPVSEFMTPNPQTLQVDAKIAFAVQRMDLGGYRHVPITGRNDKLVGIISVRDILRYLTEQMSLDAAE